MIEAIMILLAIFISFFLGCVVILFTGGKTTLQYLQCKFKRKNKIFMWVDSFTGRESVVGTIEGDIQKGTVSWKYNGEKHITVLNSENVARWKDIYYMGVNLKFPLKAYNVTELGEFPPITVDLKEFQHILTRALSQPTIDNNIQQKMLIALAFGLIIIIGVLAILFFKIDTLSTSIGALNVL